MANLQDRTVISPELLHLLQALPEAALFVDGDGQILAVNHTATDLVGASSEALRGQRLSDVVVDSPTKVAEYLRLCSRSRQAIPGSLTWKRPGGATLDVRLDGTLLAPRAEFAAPVLFLRCRMRLDAADPFRLLNQKVEALSKEILDRKKLELQRDELLRSERAARIDAERSSRMKDEFLATLSHELRTPLNAILGWTHLLRRSHDSQSLEEGLQVIERNANVQRVDLAAVIDAAVQSIQPAAESKNIRLQVTLDPLAGPVKGDPNRLQQVVWNLLSNAVKFTPKGGRVQVFLERVNSHVEITVSDTGEGIRPEFLPHVFERFRQADSSTTRRFAGLGLGLSIVKQLVELHGGAVRAKSPGVGMGSTFVVHLPLLVLHEELESGEAPASRWLPNATSHESLREIRLAGVRVLVVDDEPDARDLVGRLLHGSGAEVLLAASAAEGLELLRRQSVHLIVSDIGMPEMDGFAFLQKVRNLPSEQGGRVPALALSAFVRTEDRTRALHAGYNMHLSKPLDVIELLSTVASLVGRL